MTHPELIAVGNVLVDHVFRVTNDLKSDGGAYITAREQRFGGVEMNVACLLAGLGTQTGLIGRTGTDDDGIAVARHLATVDVDTSHVQQVANEETSYCLVLTTPDGGRIILGGGDSTLNLSLTPNDEKYIEHAPFAFASAYTPAKVLRKLTQLDTNLVFDLSGRFEDLEHRGLTRKQLDDLCPKLMCFVGNRAAVRSYLHLETTDLVHLATALTDRGVSRGVITAGDNGALLFNEDERVQIDAVDVEIVDTTGAGDAFTAGLINAWFQRDKPMEDAGRFAAAAAARNCTVEGAHAEPPSREEVEMLC